MGSLTLKVGAVLVAQSYPRRSTRKGSANCVTKPHPRFDGQRLLPSVQEATVGTRNGAFAHEPAQCSSSKGHHGYDPTNASCLSTSRSDALKMDGELLGAHLQKRNLMLQVFFTGRYPPATADACGGRCTSGAVKAPRTATPNIRASR